MGIEIFSPNALHSTLNTASVAHLAQNPKLKLICGGENIQTERNHDGTTKIEIEEELRENKIADINVYLQRLRRVLADARPLMDEYALIEKFEFAEERYKFFFESHSTAYEKIFLSMKKKFGALHQQVSQLGLAIEALQNLSSIIDRFKI